MKQKKIPLRTCIGCGLIRPKRELARVVSIENKVAVDTGNMKNGRGAYLCRIDTEIERVRQGLSRNEDTVITANIDCVEKARENHAFERAFKQKIESVELAHGETKRNENK